MIADIRANDGTAVETKEAATKVSPTVAMRTPPQKENPSMACLRQPAAPPVNPATVYLFRSPV